MSANGTSSNVGANRPPSSWEHFGDPGDGNVRTDRLSADEQYAASRRHWPLPRTRRKIPMQQVVGLDIGTSAVRAAELEFGSGAPKLVAFGQVGLPPGAIVDGEVQDLSAVSDAIERLWQNGKFQSKSVVVGIAGLRAITREVDLPWVPDEDVDSAVRFQSEEV